MAPPRIWSQKEHCYAGHRGANPTKLASPLLISLLLSASVRVHAQQTPEKRAQTSTDAGLAIVDSGKYAESSDAAAQSFKAAVPKDQWQSMLGQTCGPLGKIQSRKSKLPRTPKLCRERQPANM